MAANGGVFAVAALGAILAPAPLWTALGGGALAAATADTWSTEIGTLAGRPPRSILSGRRVPPGTSGGVTLQGTAAALLGAGFIGGLATLLGWPPAAGAGAVAGGFTGALADSVLGAALQERRRCPTCEAQTERIVHTCGTITDHAGGLPWLDNNRVNLLSGMIGGAVAVALAV